MAVHDPVHFYTLCIANHVRIFKGKYHPLTTQQHHTTASQNSVFSFLHINFAGGGVDYSSPNPTTFIFTSGQPIQCTNIPINEDSLVEGGVDETFTIVLSSPSHPGVLISPALAFVYIDDNDGKSLFITS